MIVFLRLPHWLIFILTFGLFLFVGIAAILPNRSTYDQDLLFRGLLLSQATCLIVANFWRYAIGTRLHKKNYYNSFMLLIFRWCLYFLTLVHAARFVMFPAINYFDGSFNMLANTIWLVGGIYCDYFLARMLVSVEQQRDVAFKDFAGTFFSFIFLPVGVWWLQPRVNNIFKNADVDLDTPLDYKLDERSGDSAASNRSL